MKYFIALFTGILAGIVLLAAALYFNPFVGRSTVSILAVSDSNMLDLSFSVVPEETLVITNDRESMVKPHPARVQKLWEPTINNSQAMVALLTNRAGEAIGVGIKISSASEATQLLKADAIVNSVWQIYLPGRGAFFIDQTVNYWSYLHDIVLSARFSSGDNWRGTWHNIMTNGPNALGTARVTGANGEFAGIEAEAVESIAARAFSSTQGPVAMMGNLTVANPIVSADQ